MIPLLILIQLEGLSQTSKDTTCLPNADLKKALVLIEQGKVTAIELEQARGHVVQLQEIVKSKSDIISTQDARITNYELQKSNYQATVNLQTETIKSLNKALKKEKSKRAFTTGAGAFLVMGLTYLLIIK